MTANDISPLPDTEVHYLRSEHVGDEFKILVGHSRASGFAPSHVLFMGDPWGFFGTAVEMIRVLEWAGDLPPLLVVAVGYRLVTVEENLPMRCRDFTPTIDLDSGTMDPAMMGGAGRFLAFLRDELKPWVQQRYGVDPDDAAFFGDSLGGLFALYVLLTEPDTFRRYGMGSPSLWWDHGVMFDREAEYARAHDDLPAKVFVSVGGLETPAGDKRWLEQLPADKRAKAEAEMGDDGYTDIDMVADAERMVALLRGRAYPSLEIEYEVLPGEYHQTALPSNLSRSLRYLFDAPR
jgi:predicted alpha/beta superfamily hydrolase